MDSRREERAGCICGAPIRECMGYVIAGDFLKFVEGMRKSVRELCGECGERPYREIISFLYGGEK